jgi:hypothetical protein
MVLNRLKYIYQYLNLNPLDRRLGGPQSRSGRRWEEKILDPTGTRTPPYLAVEVNSSVARDGSRARAEVRRSISHAPQRDKARVHCTVNDINLTHMRGRCITRWSQ